MDYFKIFKALTKKTPDSIVELSLSEANNMVTQSIQKTPDDIVVMQVLEDDKTVIQDVDFAGQAAVSSVFKLDRAVDNIILTHFAKDGFIQFQSCAILMQNWMINKICNMPPEKAISTNYVLTADKEGLDLDRLKQEAVEKLKINERLKELAQKTRSFGQALMIPQFKTGDEPDMSIEFNIDAIKQGSLIGFSVLDPYWYYPEITNYLDPSKSNFYEPEYFRFSTAGGKRIHKSWCVWQTNSKVPDILKPTYWFGGYPIPQLIYKAVYIAEKTKAETFELARSKRLMVLDINPLSFLLNQNSGREQLKALEYCRSNFSTLLKSKDQNVQQLDTSLSGLSDVLMDNYQIACAAGGVPATEILETQPKGFNSAGTFEEKQMKKVIKSIVNNNFTPAANWAFDLIAKSTTGNNYDISAIFDDIDTPTEKERAEIQSIEANTIAKYYELGVISPENIESLVKNDKNNPLNGIELDLQEVDGGFDPDELGTTLDEFKEDDHPRDDDGRFASNENSSYNGNMPQNIEEILGKEHKGVKGQNAINLLLKEKNGHIRGAFTREGLGDIDLVWGDDSFGLSHIIKKRTETDKMSPEKLNKFLSCLGETIEKGKITKNNRGRFEILYNGSIAVISPEIRGNKLTLLLSAYRTDKK